MLLKTNSIERKVKSIIPQKVKKLLLKIIVNSFSGYLIKHSNIKFNLFNGIFDYKLVTNYQAALIFFGVWESAEIRFAKRFAKSSIIIELGSSVGVTLGVLNNVRSGIKFICIEASKKNYSKLKALKAKIMKKNNKYILLNKAIHYGSPYVNFEERSAITSQIAKGNLKTKKTYKVKSTTLTKIIKEYSVRGNFTLICDIEGAEAAIFFKDKNSLKLCETIIIEIEKTITYTINQQILQIKKLGFKIVEFYGNVFVFTK